MKTQIIVWLSGFVAGLVVLESLRRLGDRSGQTAEGVAEVVDAGATRSASVDKPKGLNSIVAGATAQAERARQMVGQIMPWVKDSTATLTATTPPPELDQPGRLRATRAASEVDNQR